MGSFNFAKILSIMNKHYERKACQHYYATIYYKFFELNIE